jgi:hypothetical protein
VTEPTVHRGETVYLVGLSSSLRPTSRKFVVTNPYAALKLSCIDSPRYRATNMEFIDLDTGTLLLSIIYTFILNLLVLIAKYFINC